MNVTGNIHATGNITADGDITLGDADTDNIVNARDSMVSDIMTQITTYNLEVQQKIGQQVITMLLVQLLTHQPTVGGVDPFPRAGNIIYVAENGDDNRNRTYIPRSCSIYHTRFKFSNIMIQLWYRCIHRSIS